MPALQHRRVMSSLRQAIYHDYIRHGRSLKNLALWSLGVYRFGRWCFGIEPTIARTIASKVYGGLFLGIEICTGNTINREVDIGEDFHLVHSGNVRIHPDVVFGDRVGIMNDVTIGTMGTGGVPVIGDDVFIGVGARVLGPIRIGDGAKIAANSLVLSDVPPGATAVGVPAKILQYTGRKAA